MTGQISGEEKHIIQRSSNEGKELLVWGAIKMGTIQEKAQALIERNHKRMENAMKNLDKAEEHEYKAKQWEKRIGDINLSMPESVEYLRKNMRKRKSITRA